MGGPLRLGFLMFPGFPMACLTSAIEPLRAANEITGRREFVWTLVAETSAPVRSSAEIGFEPDVTLQELEGVDQLYLISPPTAEFGDPRRSPARLRWLDRTGVTLGAFSGGIFPLARAGLMEGRPCSVHWCYEAAFKADFPAIEAREVTILREGRRITASGAGAVFDLMLRLVEERLGRDCMTEVACWFQHPVVRGPDVTQRTPGYWADRTQDMLPQAVAQAIRLFSDNIEEPLAIADVAREVGVSPRQLDRSFRSSTGQAPLRYYRMIRMKKARQLVQFSDESLTSVALSVGYASSTPMVRHYVEEFGLSPQADRAARNSFREKGTEPRFAAQS